MKQGKLVRDKIPQIIIEAGKKPITRILDNNEYLDELDKKLNEETAEYQADKSIEEMADILEVLFSICEARGYSIEELWNLMPMDSSLNSSKSNRLPRWEPFFVRFARNQFLMYNFLYDETKLYIRKLYEACYCDNLHSIWANQELYRKGNSETEFYNIL